MPRPRRESLEQLAEQEAADLDEQRLRPEEDGLNVIMSTHFTPAVVLAPREVTGVFVDQLRGTSEMRTVWLQRWQVGSVVYTEDANWLPKKRFGTKTLDRRATRLLQATKPNGE